jgi:division protein CdvB (Snf7/Vps24/ESCRT-III family)
MIRQQLIIIIIIVLILLKIIKFKDQQNDEVETENYLKKLKKYVEILNINKCYNKIYNYISKISSYRKMEIINLKAT